MVCLKKFLTGMLFCLGVAAMPVAVSSQSIIPEPANLQTLASQAASEKKSIVVLFEAEGCPYCERVMREYLEPMAKNAEYRKKVRIVRLDTGSQAPLTDFQGRKTTPADFARTYRARLTPTVIVFTPDGKPASDPLVGFSNPDYYGFYLDKAIDAGVEKTRG
ncbi:thioredoxin family protein [Thermithiobacillus plumbiphilus]|uniref:Thioredoxin family protein n=1 Tax=Thermithiobacillus plumbiphilus TaxID=1729899 RepID=A0ABU9D8A0_9PROT